ncbi:MAG: branched-chain amino acid ABC transporter permease [SAR86 cluster bacterium]|jgi:branched-chain amino acid transport system permease protein|nr:branched-chain amino acid ABC transporter permease [Candidatus Pseudothioglobus aerophilus]MBT3440468.1 branched-chain amino acid ABC transporter permease [Gammaproteobacteria bacterium]MDO7578255.1 branched-chain amino acid ABC transporter permease [SAR86 cluster bacterium]MDP0595660.1 branched-chain amino acid ABC transporter permease [Candidatus Thioglobus sp.]MBT4245076.1 branched-chain amino acid ABC transporter permease [Gammaproteobacteria bacterium]
MNNLKNVWQSYRAVISFALMGLVLLFVGFNQSWALVIGIINMSLISAIMALGVNIQWGYAGLFNVGIMGFAALGGVSVVLISQQPVIEAIDAGGIKMLLALALGAVTIAAGVLLNRRGINKWLISLVVVIGYLLTRYYFSEASDLIEKVDPAITGYLGGFGLPVMLSWVVGGLAAAGAAWWIGKITLSLRSDYLAIATLGISEIIIYVIKNEDWFVRGLKNVYGLQRPVPYEVDMQKSEWLQNIVAWIHRSELQFLTQSEQIDKLGDYVREASVVFVKLSYSGLFLVILVAFIVLSNLALNSPWGRKVRAIRDNEVAASAMGKNITRQHLQIFVIGSAIVGIAGALLVTYDGIFIPTAYQPLRFTFLIWVMVIVGGSGNNLGSVLGAFIMWFIWIQSGPIGLWVVEMLGNYIQEGNTSLEFIEDRVHYLRLVFMGSIMLLIMRFSPGGILPEKNKEL